MLVLAGMALVFLANVARTTERRGYTAKEEATEFGPFTQDKTLEQGGLTGRDFYKLDESNANILMFSLTQLLHTSGNTRFCTAAPPDGGSLWPETCRSFVN